MLKQIKNIVSPRPPKLLFVHIPKTAGISLYSALEKHLGYRNCKRWEQATKLDDYLATPDDNLQQLRLLSGHFSYEMFMRKNTGDRYVFTLLREPLERIRSTYYYLLSDPNHPRHDLVRGLSIDQFIENTLAPNKLNRQCWFISGHRDFEQTLESIENNFDLVGIVESMDPFLEKLSEAIKAKRTIRLKKLNKTSVKKPSGNDISIELANRFRQAHGGDYKLWQHIARSKNSIIGKSVR